MSDSHDHAHEEYEIRDQSVPSTFVESFASIVSTFVAAYLFFNFYRARQEIRHSTERNMFSRSVTLATLAMLMSVIFSITNTLIHIEMIAIGAHFFEDFFGCDSSNCFICSVLEQISRLTASLTVSLHFLVFVQIIMDNFNPKTHSLNHIPTSFKILQLIVIVRSICTDVPVMILLQGALFQISSSSFHVCFVVENSTLTVIYSISGGIATVICIVLLLVFLRKSCTAKFFLCHICSVYTSSLL